VTLRTILSRRGWPLVLLVLWCLLTTVALIPVWHQRMLPLLDTPDHLALARAWHDYHDPASHLADYYTLRVRLVPYMLFYGLIHALLFVCKIEIANKLVLSGYLVLFPLSVLALARALGRSPWLALGAFALAFNPGWAYGFTSYVLATCLVYFGWAALLRALDSGRRRWFVAVGVLAALCYLGHVLAWTLFGLGAIGLVLLDVRRWRRGLSAALAMLPSLGLALFTMVVERKERAYTKTGDHFVAVWHSVGRLAKLMPKRMLELFPGPLDMVVLATLALTTLVLCVWRGPGAPPPESPPRSPSVAASPSGTRRLLLLVGLLLAAYAALPYSISKPMSWWYVGPRVPALLAPLLLLLPARAPSGLRRWLLVPALVGCVVLPLHLTRLYGDFNQRNVGLLRLIDKLPRGTRVMVLARGLIRRDPEASADPSSTTPVYWHFMSWPMALKGGMSPYLFDQGIPVRPRPGLPRYDVSRTDFITTRTAPQFDYYIVHGEGRSWAIADGRVRELEAWGDWTLYQRIVPQTDDP
jgi:hypothetical protein